MEEELETPKEEIVDLPDIPEGYTRLTHNI